MSKKLKIFYIVDLIVMVITILGMFVVENTKAYGLAALGNVAKTMILMGIFGISVGLFVIVSIIHWVVKRKKKAE